MHHAARTLSSTLTFTVKMVLPVCWLMAWGSATAYMFLCPLHDASGTAIEPNPKWAVLGFGLVGLAILCFCAVPLKRVRLDGGHLYVSNYWSEVAVPLGAIAEVREIAWLNFRPVVVAFRQPTRLGEQVMFMPKARGSVWSANPVVNDLRQAIAAATPSNP